MNRKNWIREELIVAFNLYCKIPFSKINHKNPLVSDLAKIVGRSESAVALKLANFARLDPDLQKRKISGMSHGSKGEEEIWNEFHNDWEELAWQSEQILAKYKTVSIENIVDIDMEKIPVEGKERETLVKTRVNQSFFRSTILASFDYKCCITGISHPELLIASHIVPWSIDEKNRMNPKNGLCLNALMDKAFDNGLITITTDFRISISPLLKNNSLPIYKSYFFNYDNKYITLPSRFLPDHDFLTYHNNEIFKA